MDVAIEEMNELVLLISTLTPDIVVPFFALMSTARLPKDEATLMDIVLLTDEAPEA